MLSYTTQNTALGNTFSGALVGTYSIGVTAGVTLTRAQTSGTESSFYNTANTGFTTGKTTILETSATRSFESSAVTSSHIEKTDYTSGGNITITDTYTLSYTSSSISISDDTSHGSSSSFSSASGVTASGPETATATAGASASNSNPTTASSLARTASVTSSETYRDTFTYGYETTTATTTDNGCVRYTTSSETFDILTVTPTTTGSAWNTDTTTVSHASTYTDTDAAGLTVEGDSTRGLTDATHPFTSSVHRKREDSVYLLSDGGSEFLRGYMLWSIASAGPDTTTAKFTDLYTPSVGNSFTISDYGKFTTASLALPVHSRSVSGTITFTDGFSSSETSTHTHTVSLGAVGTSLSTNTAGSTTRFTHTDFVSGYETSGDSSFTTGTSVGSWDSTSSTGTRLAWANSYTTTATAASRSVTADEVLRSVRTVTRTAGTSSFRSFLGLSRFTTSRVIAEQITITRTSYHLGFTLDNYTTSFSTDNGDPDESSARSSSFSGSHNYASSSSIRMEPNVLSGRYNPPGADEAWMTTPARGWAGFCGTFTQANPAVYLTTTSGLAAGSTFTTASIQIGTVSMEENLGVSIIPVASSTGVTLSGSGLASSSIVSVPSALETILSIAATWTSTTSSGITTTGTTRSAMHTAGMSSPITGIFWTALPVTMDSSNANIGYNSPHASLGGYVAGNNRMGSHEVRLMAGAATWTQYTAGVSDTTGPTGSTSGSNESVSFTVPQGAAVRVAKEPILTVSWVPAVGGFEGEHAIPTCPHPDFTS